MEYPTPFHSELFTSKTHLQVKHSIHSKLIIWLCKHLIFDFWLAPSPCKMMDKQKQLMDSFLLCSNWIFLADAVTF